MAFKDKATNRLGSKGTLRMDRGARDALRGAMMPYLTAAAQRIADRANAASSWGAYEARTGRNVAWVAARSARKDSNRARRLLSLAQGAAE